MDTINLHSLYTTNFNLFLRKVSFCRSNSQNKVLISYIFILTFKYFLFNLSFVEQQYYSLHGN